MLGSSLLRPTHDDPSGANDLRRYSRLFLSYYNKADRDVFYDEPSLERNELTYGCFGKESFTRDGVTEDYINIFPQVEKTDEQPGGPFLMRIPDWVDPDTDTIEAGRKFGYDLHFTAPAQPAVALWEGSQVTMMNYISQTFSENFVMTNWGFSNTSAEGDASKQFTLDGEERLRGTRGIIGRNGRRIYQSEIYRSG